MIEVALDRSKELAVARAPLANRGVVAAACDDASIRTVGKSDDRLCVASQNLNGRSIAGAPDANRAIETRRREPLTIGTESHRPHIQRVPAHLANERAARPVPQTHDSVLARGRDRAAIRTNRHGPDGSIMTFQRGERHPVARAPYANDSVITAGDEEPSIATEGDRRRAAWMTNGTNGLQRRQSPQRDRSIDVGGSECLTVRAERDFHRPRRERTKCVSEMIVE